MLSELTYSMKSGTLNQIYDKVINCKVVKPPYEGDEGIYNQDFFLDKRDGHTWFKENGFINTDSRKINGTNYYLYNNGTNCFVGKEDTNDIIEIAGPFPITSNTPIRMAKCFGGAGTLITSGTITNPVAAVPSQAELQYYGDGWVKLTLSSVAGVAVGQYIEFQDGVLKGGSNKIFSISGSDVYIIGTNTRGSLPLASGAYKIFSTKQENIMIGTSEGLQLIHTNGTGAALTLKVTAAPVDDIVEFNGVLFLMTGNEIFFSRKTFDDNTQFYPIDKFLGGGITKLIDLGKILVAVGEVNKIYAPATNTDNTIGYVEYNVNYQGTIYSKYSYIYSDSTFYIVQADKQLMQIDIVTLNTTTYDMIPKSIEYNTRGIFEGITGGEIYVNHTDRYIHFCNIDGGKTTIYQYDKQYTHWLIQNFDKEIYQYGERVLTNGGVGQISGTTDWGVEFEQEINFMVNENNKIIFPLLIRTQFGLTGDKPVNVTLDIKYTEGANLVSIRKKFGNYLFDATLNNIQVDNLIGYEEDSKYTGNTVSLQHNIFRGGRFFKFKYHSYDRFIIGESYLPVKNSKYFINEILQTN